MDCSNERAMAAREGQPLSIFGRSWIQWDEVENNNSWAARHYAVSDVGNSSSI